MKVVLTGATGNTGGHALTRLLSLPTVTEVVILSRRALSPPVDSTKVTTLILTNEEFLEYPPRVLEAISGAVGAVWTLGKFPKQTPEGLEEAERIGVAYPWALMRAVVANPPRESGEPFRLVPEDPNASLWFGAAPRKKRAAIMQEFHQFAAENSTKLDIIVCKPWFIRPPNESWSVFSLTPTLQIPVDVLAAALVEIAVSGSSEKNLRNEELKAKGVEVLKTTVA
ncbi:hypothetical protein RQP46_002442 [Phenoliferia psychrophenolica]